MLPDLLCLLAIVQTLYVLSGLVQQLLQDRWRDLERESSGLFAVRYHPGACKTASGSYSLCNFVAVCLFVCVRVTACSCSA